MAHLGLNGSELTSDKSGDDHPQHQGSWLISTGKPGEQSQSQTADTYPNLGR